MLIMNIPESCVVDGLLVCTDLLPMFSSVENKSTFTKSVRLKAPEITKTKNKLANGVMSIKLSKTGKCHKPGGSYYKRTKTFTPFATMEECLAAGGVESLR